MILFFIVFVLFIIALVINLIIYNKYKNFITEHSILLQNLRYVNSKYHFNAIQPYKFRKLYDNDVYYSKVSPIDYLTYQLQFCYKDVKDNISKVVENSCNYELYVSDVNEITYFNEYDIKVNLKFKRLLQIIEEKIYYKSILNPVIEFNVLVEIVLTNINGSYRTSKRQIFDVTIVEELIEKVKDKSNNRFNNEQIWKSISIVERAKVSNKMRFAVYKRDNNRCRKCGSRYNLEIDHIIPIAKGGKTTFDNLQTLCKKCNEEKSDTIEAYTTQNYDPHKRYCKVCKAPMKIVNGKYGMFYGCTNYPKCNYKERI